MFAEIGVFVKEAALYNRAIASWFARKVVIE